MGENFQFESCVTGDDETSRIGNEIYGSLGSVSFASTSRTLRPIAFYASLKSVACIVFDASVHFHKISDTMRDP
jgi:hypothetical protein